MSEGTLTGPADEPLNQARPLAGYNAYGADPALVGAVTRLFGENSATHGELLGLGALAGSFQAREWGRLAEAHHPVLVTHDRYGRRVDEVEFHPAWHELMTVAVGHGLGAAPWQEDPASPRHTARAAKMLVWGQTDGGHLCPVSMTYAAVPALQADPGLAALWTPRLASKTYDFGLRDPAAKAGCLAGMGMTEKQGGSDVRANTTAATPVPGADGEYTLVGHKWFTSAPMCDVFLVLAQAPGGLTCFLIPRVLPDGTRNSFRLQRLKDKLGNRANASSEVEFHHTRAWRVGDEGRGVATIIEMVAMTRLDCVTGSASLMRAALAEAVNHTRSRKAFGKLLADQPLMRTVLADLALESEAATLTALHLASATDAATGAAADEQSRRFRRIGLAVAKYWVTKRCAPFAAEALECLGGNGYVEESGMPRLYREAPLNSIWEGSGNVNALDVLRALAKEAGVWDAFLAEVGAARGADARFDAAFKELQDELGTVDEAGARRFVERMALVLQGSLMLRFAPAPVADAFVASRLGGDWGRTFGTLPRGLEVGAIVDRALAL
ncbi:acyl-CoA dehydrogenase family protein [Catenulispora yoronensis]|uniref:Acyl-CoA dehydrogenase family protein n=1 Tax=Catenulispora yoronensis TaxID=450799 RepID=A0ABN2UAL6_9ACTN